jgi:hypothetical protein
LRTSAPNLSVQFNDLRRDESLTGKIRRERPLT